MKEEQKEKMLNLLADRAIFGLSEDEKAELAQVENEFPELRNESLKISQSFELATAAFSLVNLNVNQPLPNHLNSKILADADKFFAASEIAPEEYQKTLVFSSPQRSIWNRLGWLLAALACIALLVNIWLTRVSPPKDLGGTNPQPTASPVIQTNFAEQREQLLASAGDVIQENWTDFNPKQPRNVSGDVVWSNSRQKGFVRFRNLPVNDTAKETYQLWIFDKNQDADTPVDGGTFDVDQNGDVIIPIDAKLKIQNPTKFAVTAEKPGGVVVSKLGKVMAVAKIET
ncbi:MAG: anti-sigma factor [Pyrinomonadaceae bacterium]